MTATVKHDEKGPTEKWLPQISTTRTLVKMQIMKMQKYEVISFINSANTFYEILREMLAGNSKKFKMKKNVLF